MTAVAGCGGDSAHDCSRVPSACDITSTACQSAVLAITACEHGDPAPKIPPMRVIDTSQFRDELVADAKKAMVDTRWDEGLAALHLTPPGSSALDGDVDVTVNGTAAYYDPEVKRVSIIRSALDTDQTTNMFTLSHELTHYLQDLEFGLIDFDKKHVHTTDQSVATTALIEGDAVVTSTRVYSRLLHLPFSSFDWGRFEDALNEALMTDLSATDSPLATISFELPYGIGSRFVENAWQADGRSKVDALFDSPPASVIDLLGSPGAPTRIETLDCGLPVAPAGFTLAVVDSLGYTGAFALMQAAGKPDAVTAGQLRGDAIGVYPADDGSVQGVIAWRLRFASKSAEQTFSNAIVGLDLHTLDFDSELLITTSSMPAESPLKGDALNACPPPVKPGDQHATMQNSALRRLRPQLRRR